MTIKNFIIKFDKTILIILGFLFCQNIIVPIKIGQTSFNISILLGFLYLVVRFIFFKNDFLSAFKKIPIPFYAFILSILLSLFPALLNIGRFGNISAYFKGLIFYFLSSFCTFFLGLLVSKEERKHLFLGIFIGFNMNVIVSIIVYVVFNSFGYALTFTALFKNSSFFEPNYFSSAQGLFLEPSHMAGFLLVTTYLLIWFYKKTSIRIYILIISWIVFLLYGMGNLPIFIFSQLALFLVLNKKSIINFVQDNIIWSKKRTVFVLICLLLIVSLVVAAVLIFFGDKIENVLIEFNPFSKANIERFKSAFVTFEIFLKNPFGVGFNLSGIAINTYYQGALATSTTHSYLLKILVEQGFIGAFCFIWLVWSISKKLIKRKKDSIFLVFAFICGIIFSFLNGPIEPYLFMTLGICSSILNASIELNFKNKKISLLEKKEIFADAYFEL